MTKAKKHGILSIRGASVIRSSTSTVSSDHMPPPQSNCTSVYTSEDEGVQTNKHIFPFMALPSELRNKIYTMVFSGVEPVMDLDPSTFSYLNRTKSLAILRVSRQLYQETYYHFFSTHTFRLFPTYPGRYFKTKRPLLARLPPRYRAPITVLQLRLGPGWNNPPRGWVVNDALGLADCVKVRVLKIFVEFDPSDDIFQGFRAGDGFYEHFCAGLLEDVFKGVPSIQVVEFDAYTSVKRTGNMMSSLEAVVAKYEKAVAWGPERGWDKETDQAWLDAVLLHPDSTKKLSQSIVVFA